MRKLHKIAGWLRRDEQGITGLETAIVLIAFVVVSSVFAFAALSTGLFSSDKPESTEGRPWGQPLKKLLGAPLNLG